MHDHLQLHQNEDSPSHISSSVYFEVDRGRRSSSGKPLKSLVLAFFGELNCGHWIVRASMSCLSVWHDIA